MLSGTITVFHESKNATLALRGCTHFENIRHTFSKKSPSKTRHFHHDKRCMLENKRSVAPLLCSTSPKTPLLPYEVAPTSRTFGDGNHTFPKKTPSENRRFHHDKRCILENECSVAPHGVPRGQQRHPCLTRLHPLREHPRRESHFSQKNALKKTDISTMINGVFWKMNAQWHPTVFHESNDVTPELRGCTHFENIHQQK